MKYTKLFGDINKNNADIAGGKGASLGEMLNVKIPVPDGFVVLSTTFDLFLKKTDLIQEIDSILDGVDHNIIHEVERASQDIQNLIISREIPQDIKDEIKKFFNQLNSPFVAVRSSATAEDGADHAWAGQLESYLNTNESSLLENVKKCWASLFTPRAIFYRFEKGLHKTKISVAVVVQKMVQSEISGIAFSVHPVTEDKNQIIIEAGLGLGEAIVSGSVTPDSYVVEKDPKRILDVNVNEQNRALYRGENGGVEWRDLTEEESKGQVLSSSQILELSEIIIRIENHYDFPCDIEWAYENGKFYIVQSRPITTLNKKDTKRDTFVKAYTRDTSLIIQQAGFNSRVSLLSCVSKTNPYFPPVIHYLNDGVVEIWENEISTEWIANSIQDFIRDDEKKFILLINDYERHLEKINNYLEFGEIKNSKDFIDYVDELFEGTKGFDLMYFSSSDERTPKHIRERVLKIRNIDNYFDVNDKFIRKSLVKIFPDLKGFEQCILKKEINNPPSIDILKNRKENFVVIGDEVSEIISLRDYASKHQEFNLKIEIPPADSSTLLGQSGNGGYCKGRVKIIKRKEQISEACNGNIIVSTMTTPDFIPAMQKASAFITDEGGITCHAAIIAREMKKPCIIGTKFATQVLKDGDLVEVDADNGVVRVLEGN